MGKNLRANWEMVRLGDVCDVRDGTHDSPKYVKDGYPLVTSKNVIDGRIDFADVNYISKEDFDKINQRSKVEAGDIIMPMIGTIGKPVIVNGDTAFAIKNVALIKFAQDNASNIFIRFLLDSYLFKCYVEQENRGGTQKFISLGNIRKFPFPLPPLDEQKRIAKNLDLASEIVKGYKEQLAELDKLVQSVFYEMFGDPVTNEKGWESKSLQELIDDKFITYHLDGNHGGMYPRAEEFINTGVPYISANSIRNGKIDFSFAKYVSQERAEKFRKGIAICDDVLFAHNATVGPVAILKTQEPKVILGTSLTSYRCGQSLLPHFLKSYMESDGFKNQYVSEMGQTTRNQIPITAQRKYKFLIPPLPLQTRFASIVTEIEAQKAQVQLALTEAENLFNSLMQEYFE